MIRISDAIFRCLIELIEQGRSSFPLRSRWALSKRRPPGFEQNAAQQACSKWIQAEKENTNKKTSRGLNLRQQLSCAPEIDILPTAPRAWSKHPTRCACVRVDFQNPRFLPLKTRTNMPIMCTSRYIPGKTISRCNSFLKFSRTEKCANHLRSVMQRRSITFVPVEWSQQNLVFQVGLLEPVQKIYVVDIWLNYTNLATDNTGPTFKL